MISARLLPLVVAGFLTACSSPQISTREINAPEPAAVALVESAQRAHGAAAFAEVRDVSVRYEGKWAGVGPRFQPVLSDTTYRRESEERVLIDSDVIAQEHSGPAGAKVVVRTPDAVTVQRNGILDEDAEARRAAALVADAYRLFLLGPFYLNRPGVVLVSAGEAVVDGADCDQVLAVLRPGFGEASEDRVLLYIDRETRILRRVRLTLNGLASTQGAEVDVTFRDFREIGGVVWSTDFDERIRVPFDLPAHRWRLTGLDVNRGIRTADLTTAGFRGRAVPPAAPLPN